MATSTLPIYFGFITASVLLLYLVAARLPKFLYPATSLLSLLNLAALFVVGQRLPLSFTLGYWPGDDAIPFWTWQLDDASWQLGGMLSLLALALTLYGSGKNPLAVENDRFILKLSNSAWQPVLLFGLLLTGLSTLWAGNLATVMTSWTALAVLWAIFYFTCEEANEDPALVFPRLYWLLVPLFFSGITLVILPVGSSLNDMSAWPSLATTALTLAAMAQIGVLPFFAWRPISQSLSPIESSVLNLIPSLVGVGLLLQIVQTGFISGPAILLLTLFALLNILSGLRQAWTSMETPLNFLANIALALRGLLFIAGIWAGGHALTGGARLLVFVPAILWMTAELPISRKRWWRGLAPVIAFLTLAGLPLTAGFVALSSVYNAWLGVNRWLFILVLVLLWAPLIAITYLTIRSFIQTNSEQDIPRSVLFAEAGQFLPLLGLLIFSITPVLTSHWVTWLVLLLTAVFAMLISYFLNKDPGRLTMIDAAFSVQSNWLEKLGQALKQILRQIGLTLSEVALILEGDQGLLILTAFLAVILIAISL